MSNKFRVATLLFWCISFAVVAQDAGVLKNIKTNTYDGKKLLIATGKGYVEIVPFSADLIRITYKNNLNDVAKSYSTIAVPGKVPAKYISNEHFITLETSKLKIIINKQNLSISFVNRQGDTLSKAFHSINNGDSTLVSFTSDGKEAFYGGGSKAIYINKRSQLLENYNQAHFDYQFGQKDMNIAIPFLVSNRKYGLFVDDMAKSSFNIGKTNPKLVNYKSGAGPASFFFVGGETIDEVLFNYTKLTGRQPLPPRWALGYISSRYGYKSEREILDVVDKTQKAFIPLDGVVFDLFWYKADTLMGNYTWNADSFPNPHRMLAALLKKGIKTVLISEPYITQKSENFNYAKQHHLLTPDFTNLKQPHIFGDFWASPAALVDIFKPEAQKYYWGFYKEKIKQGVSGWWFDLLEPERSTDSLRFSIGEENKVHNIFPLVWEKNAFDGYRRDFPKSRIFILPRSGYAGMQRYSTFPWSGDNDRSWEGLKAQIPIIMNMGLGGVGYMHSDAGGFTGNRTKNPELYSRWLEFAAFSPVMRTHADATGYSPEPIFWDNVTRDRVKKYIELRYGLLPYNYTLTYKNTISGRPLMMPVNYFDADNKQLENVNDEYLWGEQMLVAPVIVPGQTTKKVLFPKGEWIGFNNFKAYRDSAEIAAPIDSLPLFVKAGSIIPMLGWLSNTAQYDGKLMMLKYYPGTTASRVTSQLFFDDGIDPNTLQNKKYDLVNFTASSNATGYHISIAAKNLMSKHKGFRLLVAGKGAKSVNFSRRTKSHFIASNTGGVSEVDFNWDGKPLQINLKTIDK